MIFFSLSLSHLWHCSLTQSSRAFLAEILKRVCRGDPPGGTGLLRALLFVDRVSRLARDSRDDWRELKDSVLANSSI